MNFEQWLKARGLDPATLSEEQLTSSREEFRDQVAVQKAGQTVTDSGAGDDAGEQGQEPKQPEAAGATIQTTATTSQSLEVTKVRAEEPSDTDVEMMDAKLQGVRKRRAKAIRAEAADLGLSAETVDRVVNEAGSVGEGRQALLAEVRKGRSESAGAPGAIIRNHERDCNADTLQAGLMIRAGVQPQALDGNPAETKRLEQLAEQGWRYRDMPLVDVCAEGLRIGGHQVPHSRQDRVRAAFSTGAMTNIFTNVINATLMTGYSEYADTTQGWTSTVDRINFMTGESVGAGPISDLQPLPRGSEADHAAQDDLKEEYKIQRLALQGVVDQQDVIDDRFGVLTDKPRGFGGAAARVRPNLAYSILLANAALGADSVALFHATHSNLGSAAFGPAALKAGIVAMMTQTWGDANLNIAPAFVITGPTLNFDVRQLLESAETRNTTASTEYGTKNVLASEELTAIREARLDTGLTDPITKTAHAAAPTAWFLAAAAGRAPTIEVAYLSGTGRRPSVEGWTLSEGKWGVGWSVKLDIGAKALDFRGLYKSVP